MPTSSTSTHTQRKKYEENKPKIKGVNYRKNDM